MKKNTLIISAVGFLTLSVIVFNTGSKDSSSLREEHTELLNNHPLNEQIAMSRSERKKAQLPPDKHYDELFLLTMDPNDGKTHPEELNLVLEELRQKRSLSSKAPGDSNANKWNNIGPNNVAGRSKVVFFDPSDATNKRVFSGAIAGGLWVNNDITNANSSWQLVTGVPENMAVSCFAIDPTNPNIWYIGTGESYTGGLTSGTGIFKSEDYGVNWVNVLSEGSFPTTVTSTEIMNRGRYYINDIIVRDKDGSSATTNDSELFATVVSQFNRYSGSGFNQFDGTTEFGLYKAINNGANWLRVGQGANAIAAFDLELSADNTLWISTTRDVFLNLGGKFYSYDGSTYTEVNQIPTARRTEFAMSKTDKDKAYILVQDDNTNPKVYKTTDAFVTITPFTPPNDLEASIPADDFARNQAHFNLTVEVDPLDDNTVYFGAINLFKTVNGGTSYTQLTTDGGLGGTSAVHADQHGLAFGNNDSSKLLLGNDGGVYYSQNSGTTFAVREKDLVTSQFYGVGVNSTGPLKVLAGAQDNGSNLNITSSTTSLNAFNEVFTGDGAFSAINQSKNYNLVSYVYNRRGIQSTNGGGSIDFSTAGGRFINPTDLDKANDIIWSDASSGSTFNISAIYGTGVSSSPDATNLISNQFSLGFDAYISAIKVSPYDNASGNRDLIVGLSNGKLYRIADASFIKIVGPSALSATQITGANFFGSISDIEFGATNDDLFVTFHNYGVKNVWYSNNITSSSYSWSDKEGNLPNIPVKAILQNPLYPKEVIIGTELGVWYTSDFTVAAPVWEQAYNGMSSVRVTELVYRTDGNHVVASTFGRGLFVGEFSSNPLSIEGFKPENEKITVYPTIVDDYFNISGNGYSFNGEELNVYDMTGKKVLTRTMNGNDIKVNVDLSSGIYIVKLTSNNRDVKTTKIVVN